MITVVPGDIFPRVVYERAVCVGGNMLGLAPSRGEASNVWQVLREGIERVVSNSSNVAPIFRQGVDAANSDLWATAEFVLSERKDMPSRRSSRRRLGNLEWTRFSPSPTNICLRRIRHIRLEWFREIHDAVVSDRTLKRQK